MAGKINLTDQLKQYFGFDKFKGNQEAIIQNLLDGRDTFVLMPTREVSVLSVTFSFDGRYGDCYFSVDCTDEEPSGCYAQF